MLETTKEAQGSLEAALRCRLAKRRVVALCGVGNEIRGDDGAGVAVIDALEETGLDRGDVVLINCGDMPENFLGRLVELQPSHVVFIDAADLGAPPGAVSIIEMDEVGAYCTSTHGLPLTFLATYLQRETNADIFIIGIQPGNLAFGASLTTEVAATVKAVKELLRKILFVEPGDELHA